VQINLFTEEEREEYDLERVWTLRRNEKNPLSADFDDLAETEWIYDDDDGQFDNWDPMDQSPGAFACLVVCLVVCLFVGLFL
jgi:hypothetical protein